MERVPASEHPHALLIGIGNELRSDDALGLLVAREIRRRTSGAVRTLELCGEGSALMDAWTGAEKAVVVDAMVSRQSPGTLHRLDACSGRIPAGLFLSSHAFGVAEAVELSRILGTLPRSLVLLGIEGAEFCSGIGLSDCVLRTLPDFLRLVEEELSIS